MKRLLFSLVFFVCAFSVAAQDAASPRIQFNKKLFSAEETVSMEYIGSPVPLTITVLDYLSRPVGYKATVSATSQNGSDSKQLNILPYAPWKSGTYTIDILLGSTLLLHDQFVINAPSPSIVRKSSKIIEPNKTTVVTLEIPDLSTQVATSSYTLVESAPLDAVINDPSIQQIKKPELLHLRLPFHDPHELTLNFGAVNATEHLGMPNHDGVDFAAEPGTPVVAIDEGEVVPYREENNYGTTIAIQHLWGQSFYGHLSTASAQLGDKVKKGQIIGLSGNTGRSTGPHLHLGVKWNDQEMIDPLPLLSDRNNNNVAEKQLVFTVPRSQSTVSYEMVLSRPAKSIQSIELSPAFITTTHQDRLFTEQESHAILLNAEPELGDKLIQDPHLTSETLIGSQDGVIIWKNADQSILKVYDTVTKSFFEQPLLENAPNTFSIDTKEYKVDISENELRLTPTNK